MKSPSKCHLIIIQLIIIIFLGTIYLLFKCNEICNYSLIKLFSFLFLFNIFWILFSWNFITKTFFCPYILFFIAAVVFNGGQILLEVFNLNEFGLLNDEFSFTTNIKTIFYITLSLSFMHIGALLSTYNKKNTTTYLRYISYSEKDIHQIGWILLLISLIPSIIFLKSAISTVANFGYFALYNLNKQTGINSALQILTNFLIPASLFILIGGHNKKLSLFISSLLILSFSSIMLFLGIRSTAIMPLVAYFWVWHRIVRPIPKYLLFLFGFIIIFIVFPLVSLTRDLSGVFRLDLEFLKEAFITIDNPIILIISEMGGTMKTVAHTIDLVPTFKEFEYGTSYFYALYSAIPNFFTEIHPAKLYGTPSDWLVWTVNPTFAARGGGLGYSFIAEAYLNFGWVIGLAVVFIFGYLLGKLSFLGDDKNHLSQIAFVGTFLAFLIKYARADMFSVVRPLLWYSLIPFILIYLLSMIKRFYYQKLTIEIKRITNRLVINDEKNTN